MASPPRELPAGEARTDFGGVIAGAGYRLIEVRIHFFPSLYWIPSPRIRPLQEPQKAVVPQEAEEAEEAGPQGDALPPAVLQTTEDSGGKAGRRGRREGERREENGKSGGMDGQM